MTFLEFRVVRQKVGESEWPQRSDAGSSNILCVEEIKKAYRKKVRTSASCMRYQVLILL